MQVPALTKEEKALTRRYLIWCYKTTKESLDRIDRKFTQVTVDRYILEQMLNKGLKLEGHYKKLIEDFKSYVADKEKDGLKQKFSDDQKSLADDYLYLQNRLDAIQETISEFLGVKELAVIDKMYEEEMTRRILESREH